jgi:hypothetical protein
MHWKYVSSSRATALQVGSPEFKLQLHPLKKKSSPEKNTLRQDQEKTFTVLLLSWHLSTNTLFRVRGHPNIACNSIFFYMMLFD